MRVKKGFILVLCLMLGVTMSVCAVAEDITIPEIQVKQFDIPDTEGLRFVRDMKIGWNLGNTFDAFDCNWLSNHMDYESGWVGVKTTKAMIDFLADSGIRTIRIPVAWHNHMDENFVISSDWLERVAEVVTWAYERDMYIILNIHHDCDPDHYYPDSEHYENSERYMKTVWTQLAERFADFDEHLIFNGINEPRLKDNARYEWSWSAGDPICEDAMTCVVKLNQVFVDTVRAAGGNNADRYLLVTTYDANPWYAVSSSFSMPVDTAEDRLLLSIHCYTPYDFALNLKGTDTFDLQNTSQTGDIGGMMNKIYEVYVSQGVPVVIDEFGAMVKNDNTQSRVDWMAFFVKQARSRGMTCVWWDNNAFEGDGERFGLFNRKAMAWEPQVLFDTMMANCE